MFDQSLFSFSKIKQLVSSCSKTDLFLVATASIGFVSIAYGFSLLILSRNNNLLVSAHTDDVLIAKNETPPLVVEVSGAVEKPGMYSLEYGSRVGQALALAGNVTKDADAQYVTKQLNLAQTISDGDKIFIPFFEQTEPSKSINADSEGSASGSKANGESGKTSINDATQSQLMELDGVGEKRAEAIIVGRPYQSLDQLVEREILSEKLFADIKSKLVL